MSGPVILPDNRILCLLPVLQDRTGMQEAAAH